MKQRQFLWSIIASLFVVAGCSKSQPGPPRRQDVDVPKLRQAFANEKPELRSMLDKAAMYIRYGQYREALAELEKLAANPSLNDAQKKLVSEACEQVKQQIAKEAAKPAQ